MSEPEIKLDNNITRKIIHVDMDAFYASVEQRDNPLLEGKPIAVGSADERGVVTTASYEARRYGVHSAMASRQAKILCPELIFVDCHMDLYKAVSEQIRAIFLRYSDLVEPISIDEAFLDVTENNFGFSLGVEVAQSIKKAIKEDLGLIASAGVSYNKFLAKIASDRRKPDGLCSIHPSQALKIIDTLPIEAFWGVGPMTAQRFKTLGVINGRDLRGCSLSTLLKHFGKTGSIFYQFARGVDDRAVEPRQERKSVGCEETLERDESNRFLLEMFLENIIDDLLVRMSHQHFVGRTLTLKVKFSDFRCITRRLTPEHALHEREHILMLAKRLFMSIDDKSLAQGVRLIGLSVTGENDRPSEKRQTSLF